MSLYISLDLQFIIDVIGMNIRERIVINESTCFFLERNNLFWYLDVLTVLNFNCTNCFDSRPNIAKYHFSTLCCILWVQSNLCETTTLETLIFETFCDSGLLFKNNFTPWKLKLGPQNGGRYSEVVIRSRFNFINILCQLLCQQSCASKVQT